MYVCAYMHMHMYVLYVSVNVYVPAHVHVCICVYVVDGCITVSHIHVDMYFSRGTVPATCQRLSRLIFRVGRKGFCLLP